MYIIHWFNKDDNKNKNYFLIIYMYNTDPFFSSRSTDHVEQIAPSTQMGKHIEFI